MTAAELKKKLLHIELLGFSVGMDISIYYWKDDDIGYIENKMLPEENNN